MKVQKYLRKNNTMMHKIIDKFNPVIEVLDHSQKMCIKEFYAGDKCYSFNNFLLTDAFNWKDAGDGVTYLVFNITDSIKKVIAYYTLATTSIPFIDRIKDDDGNNSDQTWGIPSVEIKMFAVCKEYQDLFFQDKPIAAWILEHVISEIDKMSRNSLGIKAIFLHSTKEGENFYLNNEFHDIEENMEPLHSVDDGLREMYLSIRPFVMNYE